MTLFESLKEISVYTMVLPLIPLCFYPVSDYLKSRLSVIVAKITLTFLIAFGVLLSLYMIAGDFNTNYIVIFVGIYFLYFYHKEIDLPFFKKLFVFVTVCLCGAFSLLFATIIDYTLYPDSNYIDFSNEALLSQILFLVVLNVLLYIPMKKHLNWILSNYHNDKVWRTIWLLPLLFVPILALLIPHEYKYMQYGRMKELYVIYFLCMLTMSTILYILFYHFTYSIVQTQKLEQQNKILDMQSTQYQQLLRGVQENSRIRHDFRHQLVVISEFIKNKEYLQLEKYVHDYAAEAETDLHVYSYSPAINAVLSYYESLCQNKNISSRFSLHLPDKIPVSDQDFCVMLGNLLENALYACETVENPHINLKAGQTSANILALKIENPYTGKLKQKDGIYQSSRHASPAQGLESVKAIVEKYPGIMEILTENQIFTVKILLQFENIFTLS